MLPEYMPPPPSFIQQLTSIPPEQLLQHKVEQLELIPVEQITHLKCKDCLETKPVSEFYWYQIRRAYSRNCKCCKNTQVKAQRAKAKAAIRAALTYKEK